MERLINDPSMLAAAPLGTWVREVEHNTPRYERVIGGWKALDQWGNPSGITLEVHSIRLPAQCLRAGYGETTD